jgi:FAD/FMN-containing dehydrogenase
MGPIRTVEGHDVQLLQDPIDELRRGWSGEILTPGGAGYDAARAVWNAMVDRRPAVILRCGSAADVQEAVRLVAEHGLMFSVRGGGHHIAGNAVCEGGVLIDVSPMRRISVDAGARRAFVEPGCTLADVDAATQKFGLAVPLGINSTTGVAGLTLGGGFGWLTRSCGMTVDNLVSADVVTADGAHHHASDTENAELFWGLRGGSGNFGVVTRFEYSLHAVGPEVLAGLIVHPFDDAPAVLRYYREFTAAAPDELATWVVMRKAPPLPFLPESWHGREVLVLAVCYSGSDSAEGERVLAPLRAFGNPIADVVGPTPFTGWQQAFDPLLTPGARNYWKSHDFVQLDDGLFDLMTQYTSQLPTGECEIFLGQIGGVASRVPENRTAYANRRTQYVMNVHTRWQDPADDARCIDWARTFFAATAPYATGSVYVNFLGADETDRVAAAYGPNYGRLAELKQRYDPGNLFRMNLNIAPDAAATAPGAQQLAAPPRPAG